MTRFVAIAWRHEIEQTSAQASELIHSINLALHGWSCAFSSKGLHVLHRITPSKLDAVYPLHGSGGVVLGRLFRSDTRGRPPLQGKELGRALTDEIIRSRGANLVRAYWGRYVALLRSTGRIHTEVLRDPTGAVPCFVAELDDGLSLICSHTEDCAPLGLLERKINWDHVTAYVWYRRLVTSHTGLIGVRQVHAGERLSLHDRGSDGEFLWRPDAILADRLVEDRQVAKCELRTTVQRCVETWASCYSNILVELSGGLDSSVVLACLSQAPRVNSDWKVLCQNFFTEGGHGDERMFARAAAASAGTPLIETPLTASEVSIEVLLDRIRVATPARTNLLAEYRLRRAALVRQHGVEAIFSGQGGDHFFQQAKTPLIAAEYAQRHGFDAGFLDVVRDTALLTRSSLWLVVGKALSHIGSGRHDDPYTPRLIAPNLLSTTARDSVDAGMIRHPWCDAARKLPGAKQLQIFDIVDTQSFYYLPSPFADMVHPLISQPIIELCLQIPSYVLTYGGVDRALLRNAFSDLLPAAITARTVKGGTASFMTELLIANLAFIRRYLLEGILAEHRILDLDRTAATLTEASLIREKHMLFPVLNALQAEAWLRTWLTKE